MNKNVFDAILKLENFHCHENIYFKDTPDKLSFPQESLINSFFLEDNSFWHKHRSDCIINTIKLFKQKDYIIDVGGGNGYIVSNLIKAGFKAALFEPNINGIENARKRGITNLVCGLFDADSVNRGSVPAVGLFDVLEHIQDEIVFLSLINDLIMKDGFIYITVPAHQALWSEKDNYAQHYRRYTLDHLVSVLTKSKFNILYSTYFFSFLVAPMLLFKALPYRLKNKDKEVNLETLENEHKNRRTSNLLSPMMKYELDRISCAKSLKIGASCLVVAQKT